MRREAWGGAAEARRDGRCSAAAAAPLTGGPRSGGGAQTGTALRPAGRDPRPPRWPARWCAGSPSGCSCPCAWLPVRPSFIPWVLGRVRVPWPWERRRCRPGPAAWGMLLSFLVASAPWQLPRSTVSPRNFELSNSPLMSYMFAVVINFCRRCCVLGGAGLPRVMGCSRPRHRRAGLRGFSLGAAAAAFRVPLRPASSGKAWERGGFRVCPAGSVRVSGVLCKGKSERLSEGAVPKFREVFRR